MVCPCSMHDAVLVELASFRTPLPWEGLHETNAVSHRGGNEVTAHEHFARLSNAMR